MNVQLLIDSIVRQVTVLIAQLATSGGVRAPMAHLANQVFVELSKELQAQGISRKVSADMFGMALRAYVRKVRRVSEGKTAVGRTLWESVFEFIRSEGTVTRERVLDRFERDDELQVQAILRDLTESGMIFCSGSGRSVMYRAANESDIGQLAKTNLETGFEELVWVILHRAGPITEEELLERLASQRDRVVTVLGRLYADGRVDKQKDNRLNARDFVLPLGSANGWEAAVYDHVQAVVRTICQRLRVSDSVTNKDDVIGGSTYSFEVWQDHPLEAEVKGQLSEIRRRCTDLRQRVDAYNKNNAPARDYKKIVFYAGQSLIENEADESDRMREDSCAD